MRAFTQKEAARKEGWEAYAKAKSLNDLARQFAKDHGAGEIEIQRLPLDSSVRVPVLGGGGINVSCTLISLGNNPVYHKVEGDFVHQYENGLKERRRDISVSTPAVLFSESYTIDDEETLFRGLFIFE